MNVTSQKHLQGIYIWHKHLLELKDELITVWRLNVTVTSKHVFGYNSRTSRQVKAVKVKAAVKVKELRMLALSNVFVQFVQTNVAVFSVS